MLLNDPRLRIALDPTGTPTRTPMSHQPRINIDLDGVCADFFSKAQAIIGAPYHETSPALAWGKLSLVPNLFAVLDPLPGMELLFSSLAHHRERVQILTATPLPTGFLITAGRDKRRWVAKHISPAIQVHTVMGGANKYQFARPGDVLIDDLERNLIKWREAGGIGILHSSVPDTLAQLQVLGLLE